MLNLNFEKNYILENDWVKLTPLEESDIEYLIKIADEPNIWEHSFVKGDGEENLKHYIETTINNRKLGKEYPFLIFDKVQNEYAGSTRFYDILSNFNSVRLGYTWIGQKFRGTKVNKGSKYLLFEFAFKVMKAERVGLGAYKDNLLSIQAMKSLGCVEEGVFRNYLPYNDGRTDALLFSIIKNEWVTVVKENLIKKLSKRH